MATQLIHLWSSPRSLSTSLMYSFAQHPDVKQVLDEPLCAHYLRVSGVARPYTELVMKALNPNGDQVVETQLSLDSPAVNALRGVVFVKHIAKQRLGLSSESIQRLMPKDTRVKHVILVRDPFFVLRSFHKVLGVDGATLSETALPELVQISGEVHRRTGQHPFIIVSEQLQKDPEVILKSLCGYLNIAWNENMLSWPPGPKPYDGVWAPWWYKRSHEETRFHTSSSMDHGFPPEIRDVLADCLPFYHLLLRQADTKSHLTTLFKRGTHQHEEFLENQSILIGIRDGTQRYLDDLTMVPRSVASVSVFDSAFMLGDGVWEGIRLHRGTLLFVEEHLDRLWEGAKAIDLQLDFTKDQLKSWIYQSIDGNHMHSLYRSKKTPSEKSPLDNVGVHIRVMISRGLKPTPYQHPSTTLGKPTVVIIPEYKQCNEKLKTEGIILYTTHVRRSRPDTQDPQWNSHSKLNCINACIQAHHAGVDEALMLDPEGFVTTCNSTNFFIVRLGDPDLMTGERRPEVWTAPSEYLMPGITRSVVMRLCQMHQIRLVEKKFSLTSVYSAQEAFVTGTFSGQIPVTKIDGRIIGTGSRGPLTERIQQLYTELTDRVSTASSP